MFLAQKQRTTPWVWFASFLFLAAGAQPADAAPESGDWGASASVETAYTLPSRGDRIESLSCIIAAELNFHPTSMLRTSARLFVDQVFWVAREDFDSSRPFVRDLQIELGAPAMTDQSETWVRTQAFVRARIPTSARSQALGRVVGLDLGAGVGRTFWDLGPGDLEMDLELSVRKNFGSSAGLSGGVPFESFGASFWSPCVMLGSWIEDRFIECANNDLEFLGVAEVEYSKQHVFGVALKVGILSRHYELTPFVDPSDQPTPRNPVAVTPISTSAGIPFASLTFLIAPGSWISGTIGAPPRARRISTATAHRRGLSVGVLGRSTHG